MDSNRGLSKEDIQMAHGKMLKITKHQGNTNINKMR